MWGIGLFESLFPIFFLLFFGFAIYMIVSTLAARARENRRNDASPRLTVPASVVAKPGTSEHQTGLAVDLCAKDYQLLDEGQEATPEYQWLCANCAEYGFIVRYPDGKSDVTGIIYEPWHFRYVGRAAAREIMADGLCLEEYLSRA